MNRLPGELVNYKQWVVWRRAEVGGRNTKLPISPWSGKVASCDKPHTWSTFRHACYARQKYRCDGIGFVFTEGDPFCGIDLDGCKDADGNIIPEASAIAVGQLYGTVAVRHRRPYTGAGEIAGQGTAKRKD